MKNTILKVGLFNFGLTVLGLNSTLTQAGVVDFSKCGVNSSFAVVTQSEGPTYACGGIDNGVGNPINVLNGNKFEAVEDFKELPAFKGLSFSRFYNSQSNANTALGYGWYSSFDIKLYEQPEIIQIRLESGQRINFKKNKISLGNNQFVIRALPLNPADGWIEKKIDGSGWVWHKTQSNQDYLFQYLGGKDPHLAHITKISALSELDKNNPALNFSFIYDPQQRLAVVKNGQGQQLSFAYLITRFGLPQMTLTTPIGKYYYFLDRHHNLAQVVYPDGRRLKYSYDPKFQGGDIHNLTAKSVFDPDQKKFRLISQWQYDQQDRAILSQHANGVEKVTIQFDPRTTNAMPANYSANKPVFKNVVTNSLGQKTTYSYQVVGTQFQLLESFGAGCASCGEVNKRYRFNPQGLVAYAADLNSSGQVIRAIDLKYNDLGEVIARTVSGVGIQSQTTHYEYESYRVQQGNMADDLANASSPLLTQLNQQNYRRLKAESRNSVVAGKQYRKHYLYNQNNQLISVKESGFSPLGDTLVRETRYGYDKQGRLSWEDGPLPNGPTNSPQDSDITTYAYDTKNQLISKISGGDQALYLSNYNQYGYAENITKKDGNRTLSYKAQYNPLLGIISSIRRLNKDLPPDEKKYYFDPVNQKFTVEHNGTAQNISFNQSGYPELITLSDKDKIHIHYDTENTKQSLDIYQSESLINNIPIIEKVNKKQNNRNEIINKDDFGNTVFEFNQSTGGVYTKYDSAGNILERIYQDGIYEKRTLDYIGRFIKSENNEDVILERQYDGTLLTLQKTKNEIKTWSYRSDGKLLKKEQKITSLSKLSQKEDSDISWETKYSYNQDGSLNSEQTNNLTKYYDYRNNKLDKIIVKSKNGQNLTFEDLKFNTHNQLTHFTEKKNNIEFERKFDRYGNLLSQVYTNEVKKGFLNSTLVFLGLKKAEYKKEIKSYFYDEKGGRVKLEVRHKPPN